jgi:hypothetical protein
MGIGSLFRKAKPIVNQPVEYPTIKVYFGKNSNYSQNTIYKIIDEMSDKYWKKFKLDFMIDL